MACEYPRCERQPMRRLYQVLKGLEDTDRMLASRAVTSEDSTVQVTHIITLGRPGQRQVPKRQEGNVPA